MDRNKAVNRGIYILPNLFTLSSVFAGVYAMVSSINGSFENACIAIFVAMLLDSLDGRVARLTNTMSAFGEQFDSMGDMVSFAVAPGILLYCWGLHVLDRPGWCMTFVYVASVALRLARFNAQIKVNDKKYFQGLPCPSGAALVVGLIWVFEKYGFEGRPVIFMLTFFTLLSAVLMVSNIRFYSFKAMELTKTVKFVMVLLMAVGLVCLFISPAETLLLFFGSYVFYGIFSTIIGLERRRRKGGNVLGEQRNKSC